MPSSNPESNTQPFDPNTDDPNILRLQSEAMMFVADLKVNQTLNQQWTSLLKNMKDNLDKAVSDTPDQKDQLYKEKIKIVDNFLAQKGYKTTATYVLALTKTDFYQEHVSQSQPNDESDRFVQDILGKPALLAGWQKSLQDAQTDKTAPDKFLAAQKYNCNAQQVAASFKKMRGVELKYWTGVYGNTVITNDQGKTETGQAVVIYDDLDGVSIGSDKLDKELNKVTYKDGVLTWEKDGFTINYSGQLTFSQVTRPAKDDKDAYVGNEFFGTITYYDQDPKGVKKSIFGRIGKPPKDASGSGDRKPCPTPPSVDVSAVDHAMKYIGYFMAAVFIVDFLASIPKRFKAISEFAEKVKGGEAEKPEVEERLDEANQEVEESANEENLNENGSFEENLDGAQPENFNNENGIDQIPDEQLPPAEDVQALENGAESVNENGEVEMNEDQVAEEGAAEDPAEAAGAEEETFEGIAEMFA
jgi:hypothetical protein